MTPDVNWVERLWVVLRLHKNPAEHFQSVYYLNYHLLKDCLDRIGRRGPLLHFQFVINSFYNISPGTVAFLKCCSSFGLMDLGKERNQEIKSMLITQ